MSPILWTLLYSKHVWIFFSFRYEHPVCNHHRAAICRKSLETFPSSSSVCVWVKPAAAGTTKSRELGEEGGGFKILTRKTGKSQHYKAKVPWMSDIIAEDIWVCATPEPVVVGDVYVCMREKHSSIHWTSLDVSSACVCVCRICYITTTRL